MKFLLSVYSNIKRMVKSHILILLILVLGVTVTSTALNIYYSYSVGLSSFASGANNAARIVDLNAKGLNQEGYLAVKEALNKGKNSLYFYSVMSVESDTADYIGVCSEKAVINTDTGEWVSLGKVVVPYEFMGKSFSVGDTVKINGREFTVSGLYNASHYIPSLYSSRRLTAADYAAAGIEMDSSLKEEGASPYDYTVRDTPAIFMTYDDFVSLGLKGEVLRVRFNSALGDAKKEDFAQSIGEYVLERSGCDLPMEKLAMESAEAVLTQEYYSKFLICIFIVLLSLINAIMLFCFVLKKNQKDNLLLKSLGATDFRIILLSCAEMGIYTVVAFTVGFYLARLICKVTDLNDYVLYMGLSQYITLLAAVLAITLITVAVAQKSFLKHIKAKEKSHDHSAGKLAMNLGLKQLYLTLKNYSLTFLRELIIILQVVCVAFSFTFSATYVFEKGTNQRLINRYLGEEEMFVFSANNYVLERSMNSGIIYDMENLRSAYIDGIYNKLLSLEGMEKIAIQNPQTITFTDSSVEMLYVQNKALIETFKPKMKSGKWLTEWAGGIDYKELGYVPMVISEPVAKLNNLKVGDSIEDCILGTYYMHKSYKQEVPRYTVKIVGIIAENSKVYANGAYPITLNYVLQEVVTKNPPEFVKETGAPEESINISCYIPKIYEDGVDIFPDVMYYIHPLLFPDSPERIEEWNEAVSEYGKIYDLREIAKGMDYLYDEGTSEYTFHLWITSGLLAVGIAGYNLLSIERNKKIYGVYFSCGMPFKKAIGISMGANAVIFVLGGFIGSVWGLISADSTRGMMLDTKIYSICTAIGFIIVMFLISSITMLIQMSRLSPVNMIRKGK